MCTFPHFRGQAKHPRSFAKKPFFNASSSMRSISAKSPARKLRVGSVLASLKTFKAMDEPYFAKAAPPFHGHFPAVSRYLRRFPWVGCCARKPSLDGDSFQILAAHDGARTTPSRSAVLVHYGCKPHPVLAGRSYSDDFSPPFSFSDIVLGVECPFAP